MLVFTVSLPKGYSFFGQYCFCLVGVLFYKTVLPFWFTRSTGSTVGTPVFVAWEYAFRHGFSLTVRFFCNWFAYYLNRKTIFFIYSFCVLIIFTSSTIIAKAADRSRCFDRSATIQSSPKKIVGTPL